MPGLNVLGIVSIAASDRPDRLPIMRAWRSRVTPAVVLAQAGEAVIVQISLGTKRTPEGRARRAHVCRPSHHAVVSGSTGDPLRKIVGGLTIRVGITS